MTTAPSLIRPDLNLSQLDLPPGLRDWLASDGVRIVGVILMAVIIRFLINRGIKRVVDVITSDQSARLIGEDTTKLSAPEQQARARRTARLQTMSSLARNVTTIVVFSIGLLTVLNVLGIPLTPLLASAGIGGVVLGIGSQSLIKDFLSGLFMLFEDQYGVGDEIDTGQAIGTVRAVSLRTTRLVDDDGVTWFVRNGEISRVGNLSRGWAQAKVDMPVAYTEDVGRVLKVIQSAVESAAEDDQVSTLLVRDPRVVGVQSVTGSTMTIRIKARTVPGEDNHVARVLRERIKRALDEHDIKPPPTLETQL